MEKKSHFSAHKFSQRNLGKSIYTRILITQTIGWAGTDSLMREMSPLYQTRALPVLPAYKFTPDKIQAHSPTLAKSAKEQYNDWREYTWSDKVRRDKLTSSKVLEEI